MTCEHKKWISPACQNEMTDNSLLRDEFFWLYTINKASVVVNTSLGLLDRQLARRIAQGLEVVYKKGCAEKAVRPFRVIDFEPFLIAEAGVEATMLHVGRSSQDMHATYRSTIMRDNLISLMQSLVEVMRTLQSMAQANVDTIVPNYTNGVAAQPNSYAHYLLGFLSAFNRDAERLRELYRRVNECAMGTTVLNGTSWPLDRERMAAYLGFDRPVENAYDAAQFKSTDEATELAAVLTAIALHVCTFIQDVSVQYAQPRPWILLQKGGENTYVSSAMPQKRNPGLMIYTRIAASKLLGEANTIVMLAHNIVPGMTDPKTPSDNTVHFRSAIDTLKRFNRVLKALRINPLRALEELNLDWTASQEIADVFVREHGLPFRIGHHVASHVVSYAKAHNILPADFPHDLLCKIYREVIETEYPQGCPECPMSEEQWKRTLDPRSIIRNRRTSGGPQPDELERCLAGMQLKIEAHEKWSEQAVQCIDQSLERLDEDFAAFLI